MHCPNLGGLCVLVTRPKPQGEALCELIKESGGEAIFFPTIEICPPSNSVELENISEVNWLIFISPQAVLWGVPKIKPYLNANIKIAAIGAGTAEALQAENISVTSVPEAEWNSEGLLALPEFQNIENKKIALICGENGRTTLGDTLRARGAKVDYIYVYKRVLPNDKLNQFNMNVMVCTSTQALDNLLKLSTTNLLHIPLLVISQRMVTHAQQLGFNTIFLAKNATHHAILEALVKAKGSIMPEQPTSKRNFLWTPLILLIFLLAALGIIGYLAYFYFIPMQKNTRSDISRMEQKLQQVEQSQSALRVDTQQQNDEIKTVTQNVINLEQKQGDAQATWKFLEAQYLVNLADSNLKFGNTNVATAVKILQSADQKLKDLTEPKAVALRQALANDIAALDALPKEDVVGTYTRLMALNEQIDKLPLLKKNVVEESKPNTTENLSWWRSGLQNSWAALQKIVIVRYHEGGTMPLLTPDQQEFLYANLHAVLEKAIWALLHKQPEIYQSSLDQAIKWTQKYFVQDSSVTQAMLNELTALKQINVRPEVPAVLESLNAAT